MFSMSKVEIINEGEYINHEGKPVEPKVRNEETHEQFITEMYEVFTLVKSQKEKKVMIAIGNNIVTRKIFKNTREAKDYINSKPWDLILNTCAIMQDMLKKNEEMKNSK